MIRAALIAFVLATSPAPADWRQCTTDSDCERAVALACTKSGDPEACRIVRELQRED